MGKLIDITGQKFNKLTVIRRATEEELINSNKDIKIVHWVCQCECGNKVIVRSQDIRSGKT